MRIVACLTLTQGQGYLKVMRSLNVFPTVASVVSPNSPSNPIHFLCYCFRKKSLQNVYFICAYFSFFIFLLLSCVLTFVRITSPPLTLSFGCVLHSSQDIYMCIHAYSRCGGSLYQAHWSNLFRINWYFWRLRVFNPAIVRRQDGKLASFVVQISWGY